MPRGAERPRRSIRVEDELWDEALEIATAKGESLPALIRAFILRYVKANRSKN